jgi:phage baseplate assembly protein W
MYSIAFPKMLNNTTTNLVQDKEATASNLKILIMSDRTSLYGDPYFGTLIKKFLFEQNNIVLQDMIIDEIYTAILIFMPQIKVEREDITVTSDGVDVFTSVKCLNLLDFTTNLYNINLTADGEV